MKIGDQVQRKHPFDGSRAAGYPIGKILWIKEITDHTWHNGHGRTKDAIAILSDGTREFVWNLVPV